MLCEYIKSDTIHKNSICPYVCRCSETKEPANEEDGEAGASKAKANGSESAPPIMCAYELAHINFQYWGLQTRVERWIDYGARHTLVMEPCEYVVYMA